MCELTIIMTTDKNYIMPTKVAVYSMIKNSTDDIFFHIHVLCEKQLDGKSRNYLKEMERKYHRVCFTFDEIDVSEMGAAKTRSYVPLASYYRLYISRFINVDKCLFIDGDVIVDCNLKELFDIDIRDYYIAAVRDCAVQTGKIDFAGHHLKLQLPSLEDYVNAGVMLFNLKKIREEHLGDLFISAIGDGYPFMDQDILNKYCYGHIKYIPLRYNLFSEYYERIDKMPKTLYSENELKEAQESPSIIHYPGIFKPWLCSRLKANKLWWKYAEEALAEQELQVCKEQAKEFERKSDITYIIEKINNYKDVVIFGFSDNCRKLYDLLVNKEPSKNFLFCDNDNNKQNQEYKNSKVYSVEQLLERNVDYYWIIGSQNAYLPIRNQLLSKGISDEKMLRYIHKDSGYYDRLDSDFKEYEEMMIRG